ASACSARAERSPGSPGPAPTSQTLPGSNSGRLRRTLSITPRPVPERRQLPVTTLSRVGVGLPAGQKVVMLTGFAKIRLWHEKRAHRCAEVGRLAPALPRLLGLLS